MVFDDLETSSTYGVFFKFWLLIDSWNFLDNWLIYDWFLFKTNLIHLTIVKFGNFKNGNIADIKLWKHHTEIKTNQSSWF